MKGSKYHVEFTACLIIELFKVAIEIHLLQKELNIRGNNQKTTARSNFQTPHTTQLEETETQIQSNESFRQPHRGK
jgi:hypothetical protein